MKKIFNKIGLLTIGLVLLGSCEEDKIIYDGSGDVGIATFQAPSPSDLIINPAGETVNVYTVSVSNTSSEDRAVDVVVNDASTLDPSYYNIEGGLDNLVIPAGEYSVDIPITTPATENFPESGSVLILDLIGVEGAELADYSFTKYTIPFTVACPTVDMESIPGTYQIVVDEFDTYLGDGSMEIIAGPGENQFTMVNPFGHPNPDAGGEQNYEVVIDVNPDTGAVTVDRQNAWHYANFVPADPNGYGVGRIEGNGTALTCIGQVNFSITFTVGAGSFGTFALSVQKQ